MDTKSWIGGKVEQNLGCDTYLGRKVVIIERFCYIAAMDDNKQFSDKIIECQRRVVKVKIRPDWPAASYDAGELALKSGDWVVVLTETGREVGQVVSTPLPVFMKENTFLSPVEGVATEADLERYYSNLELEKRAFAFCSAQVARLNLLMKLTRVHSLFDGTKIIFYYYAEQRVDFRELVKELVRELRIRIEMRQIGIRHQAKMIGGIGECGREFCCSSYLKTFDPISIKMAKSQNFPLNPSKISGRCGRLLCCLTYEYEAYLNRNNENQDISEGEGASGSHDLATDLLATMEDAEPLEVVDDFLGQDVAVAPSVKKERSKRKTSK